MSCTGFFVTSHQYFSAFSSRLLLFCCFFTPLGIANELGAVLNTESKTQGQARVSQQRIDQLSQQTQLLLEEYHRITQQLDYQSAYHSELRKRLVEQDKEIANLEQTIADIQITRLHLLPLMRQMLEKLKQFVLLDLPFEQTARLVSIDQLMEDFSSSSLLLSEKFRRLMELYQTESDYSYNLGHYRDRLVLDGQEHAVDFLRVGRLALYYQTPDGESSGIWSKKGNVWIPVDEQYNAVIRKAIRMAEQQKPLEVISLPFLLDEYATHKGASL